MTTRDRTTRGLVALLAATTLSLTACGDQSDQTDPPKDLGAAMGDRAIPPYDPGEPLDADQIAQVLVNPTDVGADFKERTQKSKENDAFGCLSRIDDLGDFGAPDGYREIVFNGKSKAQQYTSIFASVATFDQSGGTDDSDDGAALLTWGKVDRLMKACTRVRTKDKTGRVHVDLRYDDDLEVDADRQASLSGKGFYTYKRQRYPQVVSYTVILVGNEIITVAVVGESGDALSRLEPLAEASVGRLNDLESAAQ